jgi:hypothetical protein
VFLCLSNVIVVVVFFVPSCDPDSVSSVHLHGFDEVRMHPYDHPLHWQVYNGSLIQFEWVPGLAHVTVVVVYFVPSCYPCFAISAQTHVFDEVRMRPYGHPLHWKVFKLVIYAIDHMRTRFFRALSVTICKILAINYFVRIVTHRVRIVSVIARILSPCLRTVRPKLADTNFCWSLSL